MYTVTRVWFGPCGWSVSRPAFSNPSRAPADLSVGQSVLVDSIPFVAPNHLSHPVAVLLVVIGNFLHEAHELWKVVEVGEQRKHPLDRRTNDHRRLMRGHLLSSVDTRCTPTCRIRNLRGRG